jgi:hypothetical protein
MIMTAARITLSISRHNSKPEQNLSPDFAPYENHFCQADRFAAAMRRLFS